MQKNVIKMSVQILSIFAISLIARLLFMYLNSVPLVTGGESNGTLFNLCVSSIIPVCVYLCAHYIFNSQILPAFFSTVYFVVHPLLAVYPSRLVVEQYIILAVLFLSFPFLWIVNRIIGDGVSDDLMDLSPELCPEPGCEGYSYIDFQEQVQLIGGFRHPHPCVTNSFLGALVALCWMILVVSTYWFQTTMLYSYIGTPSQVLSYVAALGFLFLFLFIMVRGVKQRETTCPQVKVVPIVLIGFIVALCTQTVPAYWVVEPFVVIGACFFYARAE